MNLTYKIYDKPTTTINRYITIFGQELRFYDFLGACNLLLETDPNDEYGLKSIRDYELCYDKAAYDLLVKKNIARKYTTPNGDTFYCVKNISSLKKIKKELFLINKTTKEGSSL